MDPIQQIEETLKGMQALINSPPMVEAYHAKLYVRDIQNLLKLVRRYEDELMTANYETDSFDKIKKEIFGEK